MLDLGIALGIALAGFGAGYGAREIVSYRRRKAALRRHLELGLDYYAVSVGALRSLSIVPTRPKADIVRQIANGIHPSCR